jgi:hypothetical protein
VHVLRVLHKHRANFALDVLWAVSGALLLYPNACDRLSAHSRFGASLIKYLKL